MYTMKPWPTGDLCETFIALAPPLLVQTYGQTSMAYGEPYLQWRPGIQKVGNNQACYPLAMVISLRSVGSNQAC